MCDDRDQAPASNVPLQTRQTALMLGGVGEWDVGRTLLELAQNVVAECRDELDGQFSQLKSAVVENLRLEHSVGLSDASRHLNQLNRIDDARARAMEILDGPEFLKRVRGDVTRVWEKCRREWTPSSPTAIQNDDKIAALRTAVANGTLVVTDRPTIEAEVIKLAAERASIAIPVIEQLLGGREIRGESKFNIRVLGDVLVIRFHDEHGTVQGKPAKQLVMLLKEKSVHVEELKRDAAAMSESVEKAQAAEDDESEPAGNTQVVDNHELRNMRAVRDKGIELRGTLTPGTAVYDSNEESIAAVESFIAKNSNIRGVARKPGSTTTLAKRAVERNLDRLKKDLQRDMPLFVAHLDNFVWFDAGTDCYVYQPDELPDWHFSG